MAGLEERARMHAALGDPVRLAIADRLVLGDLSPGELGADLQVPTNLMAHHLRVLQEAGLIRRVPSEGDGRRTYVQLVRDSPIALRAADLEEPERVVFVCTRNSARSQIAAALWCQISEVPVTSGGTNPADELHPRALSLGRRHGLDLEDAQTRDVAEILHDGDLVVAVCDRAYEKLSPTDQPCLHWAVPNPSAPDTDEAFETAYAQITERVGRLAEVLPQGSRHR